MASTYTSSNKITKQGVGDNPNTWGVVANTDFDLIDQALDGIVSVAISGTSSTMTMTDGASANVRNRIINFTGTLSANHTVTISPNTLAKWYWMRNSTTGGFAVIISTGGATISIPANNWMPIFVAQTNVTTVDNLNLTGAVTATAFNGSGAGVTNLAAANMSTVSHVRAVANVGQTINDVTATLVDFKAEQWDTLGEYNTATSRFTATQAGYYHVSSAIRSNTATTFYGAYMQQSIYRNGSQLCVGPIWRQPVPTAPDPMLSMSTSVNSTAYLGVGDYIEIYVFINTSGAGTRTLDGNSGANYLTIDRLIG